jgi:phospholipid-translocating ATPase
MLNSKFKASKLSCIERTLNKFMLFFLAVLFIFTMICLVGAFFFNDIYTNHWYLKNTEPKFFVSQKPVYYIVEALFYATLLSNIIPISMYISIETQRFIGTKFFEWDIKYANVKSSSAKILKSIKKKLFF